MADSKHTPRSATRSAWFGALAFITTSVLAAAFWYNSPIISILPRPAKDCKAAVDDFHSMTTVIFREHDEYKNLSRDHDHLWRDVLTPNGGFAMVMDSNKKVHTYGISMYHQLHCLQMIRSALQNMQDPVGDEAAMAHHDHADIAHAQPRHRNNSHAHPEPGHWLHCLDYLRQSILCSADGTIEPPKIGLDGKEFVDGTGERKCRDWTVLRDLSLQKHVPAGSLPERVI